MPLLSQGGLQILCGRVSLNKPMATWCTADKNTDITQGD